RPTATAPPPLDESVIHLDGSVTGSGEGGYRPGLRHGPQTLTGSRNACGTIERDAPPPLTVTVEPSSPALEIARCAGHSPASCRNIARSSNGTRTRQCDSGEAPSSRSTTGRREGTAPLPTTCSVPSP